MGLDMFLHAKLYVGGYKFCEEKEREFYKELVKKCGIKHASTDTPSAEISFVVAYWRKANHIHQWFVNNVQDGRDECQISYVSREQLQELVDTCKKVLATVGCVEAEGLLPTKEGFFFGNTDYDEYYLRGTQDTIDMIEPLLLDKTLDNWSFYYQSSW